jgi:hypothetical protein
MEICEQLTTVRNIIQAILKAKKIVNLYPENNPIYIKILKELSDRFSEFFQDNDSLKLNIYKDAIFYDSESVYQSSEKLDNLAILFFKDGVRELTFKNGLTAKEIEAFIKIISLDFEKDTIDEDIVTLFWEKDLDNIQYIVEDLFFSDDYEKKAMDELQQKTSAPESIEEIYSAVFSEEEGSKNEIILPVTDEDFHSLLEEFDKHNQDKTDKSLNMLFELFSEVEKEQEYLDIVNYFRIFIEFFIKKENINSVVAVQSRLKKLIDNEGTDREIRKHAVKLLSFTGGHSIINLIGNILNRSQNIEENIFRSFVKFLDTNAILPFMKLLGELKAIHTRKLVIDALVYLGKKDIASLYKGLSDPKWYVVRNMAYILRKINDKNAVNYLLKPLEHEDIRVRKEVIRTLGALGGEKAITSLKRCLQDNDMHVRKATLSALGNIGSAAAKQIIMEQISGNEFKDRSFDEKKQYFEALANWKDSDVYDFLVKMLTKRSFLPGSKDYDNKACAVYCLGLIGRKDAIPILNEYKNNSNKLLRESSSAAVQRIENGI